MHPLAPTDTPHVCPHPTCAVMLPSLVWACTEHWQALPPTIRQALWGATRQFDASSLSQQVAAQHALDFWAASAPHDLDRAA
jgi:hypothetical protein